MVKKRWIKNGMFASDTITLNGCVVCNPTEDMLKAAGYEEYQEPEQTDEEKLAQAKRQKLAEIEAYDQQDKVNGFKLNNTIVWLDKATRVGLMNSTKIEKELGNETTDLWLGEQHLTLNCDLVINILRQLESYALKCFNITAQHKKEVNALTTIEEVTAYDITKDYPEQLTINI